MQVPGYTHGTEIAPACEFAEGRHCLAAPVRRKDVSLVPGQVGIRDVRQGLAFGTGRRALAGGFVGITDLPYAIVRKTFPRGIKGEMPAGLVLRTDESVSLQAADLVFHIGAHILVEGHIEYARAAGVSGKRRVVGIHTGKALLGVVGRFIYREQPFAGMRSKAYPVRRLPGKYPRDFSIEVILAVLVKLPLHKIVAEVLVHRHFVGAIVLPAVVVVVAV